MPKEVQQLADKNLELLKVDPHDPSLHFKKIGRTRSLWSLRIGMRYRALGVEKPGSIVWFWIGSHADYDRLLR